MPGLCWENSIAASSELALQDRSSGHPDAVASFDDELTEFVLIGEVIEDDCDLIAA